MTSFKKFQLNNSKYVKLLGLLLDIIGAIIIAISLIQVNNQVQKIQILNQKHLGKEAKEELEKEKNTTVIGIILISVGFLLIFGEEMYASFS